MSLVECPETKHTTPDAIVFTKASNMNWKKAYTINGAGGRVKLDSYLSCIKIQSN